MIMAGCMQIGGAVMVGDTSLCFNAYKGLPGKSQLPSQMLRLQIKATALSVCRDAPLSASCEPDDISSGNMLYDKSILSELPL